MKYKYKGREKEYHREWKLNNPRTKEQIKEDNRRNYEKNGHTQAAKYKAESRVIKAKLVLHSGGNCVKCGYNKCQGALHFHHRDPSIKLFNINGRI